MDAASATEELQEGAEKKSASSTVHDVLTSDLLLKVWAFLGQEHIFQAIQVCHRWRNLSSGLDESESSEDGQLTGAVNWPAFRHLGILRQKKHSMVVKCQSRASGKVLVVKRIQTRVCPSTGESQDQQQDQGFPVRYLREVALLRAADHPNIMRLHKIFYYQDKLNLFSEFVGQNVEDYIAQQAEEAYQIGTPQHRVMMDTCRLFVRQIIEGVCYCHSVGIMLRDMKPRNVMMSIHDPTKVKLTGLALGRFASLPAEALTREVVTQCYRAPEILLGGATPVYSVPVDMWSVGCTMAEIASGRTLFEGDSEIGQLFQIFRVLGTPNEESWPGVSLLPDFLSQASSLSCPLSLFLSLSLPLSHFLFLSLPPP
jgi:serine/threonine protein kinase